MNARRNSRSLSHVECSLITILLAAIGMTLAFIPTTAAQQAGPQDLAAQYFDAVPGSASLELVSPNAVLHTPEGEFSGAAGLSQFGETLENSFSDLDFEMQSVETVDNLVVVAFTMTGIHTGAYLGLQPNCAGIAVPGMAVLRNSDAVITEQWIDYDRQTLIEQIHAFSRYDAGEGTACTSAPPTAPPSAPTCISATECETAY